MREFKIKRRSLFEAHVGMYQTWWGYYNDYVEATSVLIDAINNNYPVHTIASPLMFMIRHSLELGLKANIIVLEKFSSAKPKIKFDGKSHSLELLYDYFIAHLNEIIAKTKIDDDIIEQIDGYKVKLKNIKDILHKIDEGSYAFRYPVTVKKQLSLDPFEIINIADYVFLLREIDPFLKYTTNVLEEIGVIEEIN